MAVTFVAGGTYLSSNPATNFVNTNSTISISTWIKYAGWATATDNASMVGTYNGTAAAVGSSTGIQIGSKGGAPNIISIWTWGGNNLVVSTAATTPLPANDWVHVVYTCTALSGTNQTHSVYVNGVLSTSTTNAVQVAGVLTQMYINGFPQTANGTAESSAIQVDSTAMYNRILSLSEIQTIYNSKGMRDNITYGLIERHSFMEANTGNVATCVDFSGNNNRLVPGTGTIPTYSTGICFNNSRQSRG